MSLSLPKTVAVKQQPPDPEGTASFMRRIGYSLEEALSDIIDNSIDAEASQVLVRFVRGADRINQIIVVDNGHGMKPDDLHKAMKYGVRQNHGKGDLGKYGIGLKAAAFSQCQSLTVLSRKSAMNAGRRWTAESIADDWRLEELDQQQVRAIIDAHWDPAKITSQGTIVILDNLDSLQSPASDFRRNLDKANVTLALDLGLRFHRFLSSGKVSITIDVTAGIGQQPDTQLSVEPLDPFGYAKSGRRGYPATFDLEFGQTNVKAVACIWPPKSKDPNYRLGSGKVAARQGFYFYRNDRLIKAGGWHNLQGDTEPHSSLARVLIDMPPELDSAFRLTVQKNDFNVPAEFIDAVRTSRAGNTTFADYLKAAQDVYRNAPEDIEAYYWPAAGLPKALARKLKGLLTTADDANDAEISIRWEALEDDQVFIYDRSELAIVLNLQYRSKLTGGRNSAADAPVFKTLLFYAIYEVIEAGKFTKKLKERLALLNRMLLEALKWQP